MGRTSPFASLRSFALTAAKESQLHTADRIVARWPDRTEGLPAIARVGGTYPALLSAPPPASSAHPNRHEARRACLGTSAAL